MKNKFVPWNLMFFIFSNTFKQYIIIIINSMCVTMGLNYTVEMGSELRLRVTNDTHSRLPSDVYLLALGVTSGTFPQKLTLQL